MVFVALLVPLVILFLYMLVRKARKVKMLKTAYEEALRRKDKAAAKAAGCRYYAALRGYEDLSALDELQIENDIAALDEPENP